MVRFTPEQAIELMKNKTNIRNISVIAHVDHGKTTLSDSLLAKGGLISEELAGDSRALDTSVQEQERGITIRSTGVSLCFEVDTINDPVQGANGNLFLVNLVDSPGHIDFSSEVTAALRVTDGALVVVDCVEGVCVQTETVLRQALAERIKPVLFLNKLDRLIFELQLGPEAAYQKCLSTIESVNEVIRTSYDGSMGDITLSPEKGNVGFGSAYYGWGFTLWQFARRLAAKQGAAADPRRIMTRLWGDHFYDSETKKFSDTSVSSNGVPLQRFFCKAILEPIFSLNKAIASGEGPENVIRMLAAVGVTASMAEVTQKESRTRMKVLMRKFIHVADSLVSLIVHHLPSPVISQHYRVEALYTGPMDDECAQAIRTCDANGPVVMYVSKMVPASSDARRFYAFGRIFAGTLRTGARVRVLGSQGEESITKTVNGIIQFMGRTVQRVDEASCGVTVGVMGLDQALVKCGTVTASEVAFPIRSMKFSVSPVVRVAVSPARASDLPQLVDAMKLFAKVDPCIQVRIEDTGELIVAAAGELHLQVCLEQLKDYFDKPIVTSAPVVSFRETVTVESQPVHVKSPNGHNRLYFTASPLQEELVADITNKIVTPLQDSTTRARYLADRYDWSVADAKKIWGFGPQECGPNVVVDASKAVQYMPEIRDSVIGAFQWVTKEGGLCGEEMRGIRFNIVDAVLHADAVHRGGGQIIPSARRAFLASELRAEPRLQEPVYLIETVTTRDAYRALTAVLRKRRGELIADEATFDSENPTIKIKAYIPVSESFGLEAELRQAAHGRAFSQLVFDHWQEIPGSPFDPRSLAGTHAVAVRKRKGMPDAVPSYDHFSDPMPNQK